MVRERRGTEGLADDPLRNDLLRLRRRDHADDAVALARLASIYDRLSRASLEARPRRSLPSCEAALEAAIEFLLGGAPARAPDPNSSPRSWDRPRTSSRPRWAMRRICPFRSGVKSLPRRRPEPRGRGRGRDSANVDQLRRRAMRRPNDQCQRGDPLAAPLRDHLQHRRNGQRQSRGRRRRRERGARGGRRFAGINHRLHHKRAATRLKLDLELAPGEAEAEPIVAEVSYPEWDWKRQIYRPSYCRIVAGPAPETGEDWVADAQMQRHIRQVRRRARRTRATSRSPSSWTSPYPRTPGSTAGACWTSRRAHCSP